MAGAGLPDYESLEEEVKYAHARVGVPQREGYKRRQRGKKLRRLARRALAASQDRLHKRKRRR